MRRGTLPLPCGVSAARPLGPHSAVALAVMPQSWAAGGLQPATLWAFGAWPHGGLGLTLGQHTLQLPIRFPAMFQTGPSTLIQ